MQRNAHSRPASPCALLQQCGRRFQSASATRQEVVRVRSEKINNRKMIAARARAKARITVPQKIRASRSPAQMSRGTSARRLAQQAAAEKIYVPFAKHVI